MNIQTKTKDHELRNETAEFIINKFKVDYFVTLNFKYKTNKLDAELILKKFLNNLNRKIFGSRSRKSLVVVPSLEMHLYEGYHIHLLIEDPQQRALNSKTKLDENSLKELIRTTWQSASNVTANLKQSCPDDKSWFKTINSSNGIANYITKQINSFNKDTIAWDLANNTGYRQHQNQTI